MAFKNGVLKMLGGMAVGAVMLAGASNANAAITWSIVEQNGGPNIGSQFSVTATDLGTGVTFRFMNNVGTASSIADIYFDDKSSAVLSLPMTIVNSAGVNFQQCSAGDANCAAPANLPGGTNVAFTADYGTDVSGPAAGGINAAGEYVDISFAYGSGKSFADIVSQMNSGELVLGIHVQSLPGGISQTYISNGGPGPIPAPEPATLALFGVALAGLGVAARRRNS